MAIPALVEERRAEQLLVQLGGREQAQRVAVEDKAAAAVELVPAVVVAVAVVHLQDS